ncbi:MAG TPA: S8 family serine peptidase, partial [Nitrospiria bacterium]|nr:S8 family serine peptidase [Nitrospiria bacterium]
APRMITRRMFFAAALFLLVHTSVPAFSNSSKIDPRLVLMTRGAGGETVARLGGLLRSTPGATTPVVETIVRFHGDLSGVESAGGEIRSVIGDIATVDIPLDALARLSQLPNVVYVEAAKKVRPRLDVSVSQTGASKMRSGLSPVWAGYTGRGVIIGIVDTGIDLKHPDFKDPDEKSRVLYLWDQSAASGSHPSGFGYGNECTGAIIDAGRCPEKDPEGHGTHVAGIAAGNGSATGNGQPAYRYIGMAPDADLIVVNALSSGIASGGTILDGISYIQAKAALLGRPSVINLSLGSDLGPHDGTSNYERALDNASGTGRVIVGSVGNEYGAGIHASGTVPQNESVTVGFTLPAGDPGDGLDIWYDGADQMEISIRNVSNAACNTGPVLPGAVLPSDGPCGYIGIASSPNGTDPNNGDNEIAVLLLNGAHSLSQGAWTMTLSRTSGGSGRFDAWFDFNQDPSNSVRFTDHVDDTITLNDSGTATKPIAVGAYVTKRGWNSLTGIRQVSRNLGDIASFSSRGPRRPCTISVNCPFVQKPEIAAPGSVIMSSLSSDYTSANRNQIDPDGVHIVEEGTSMAAPHVTGAVALLLQAVPTFTSDQIKSLLVSSAQSDAFTQGTPNNAWGYGKLNVKSAFGEIVNPLPAPPAGLSSSVAGGGLTLSWIANIDADLFGYNVYRSIASGSGYTKIAALPASVVKVTDMGVTTGKIYYYVVRATNSFGSESLDSKEVSAAIPAPSDGGGGCVMHPEAGGDWLLAVLAACLLLCLAWKGLRGPVDG